MTPGVVASRRRVARSSSAFQLVLFSFLLASILISWGTRLLYLEPDRVPYGPSVFDASRRDSVSLTSRGEEEDSGSGGSMIIHKPESQELMAGSGAGSRGASHARSSMPLRAISFNIRYATGSPGISEYPWRVRGPRLCNQLNFITAGHENAFICLQEVLSSQLHDIQSQLGSTWSYIGKGREDGRERGEFSPVFYRSDTWSLTRDETRWLSPTPDRPSKGWDAALERVVTMGEFSHKETGTKVIVMSTHFDHVGVEARRQSAKLLIKFAQEWSDTGKSASVAVIGGDFNSTPEDGAYRMMTAEGSGMSDISNLVPRDKHYGNHLTYTSFGEPEYNPQRIDFLFIKEPRTAQVKTFGVLANSFDDQIRVSDHRAIVSDMVIAT